MGEMIETKKERKNTNLKDDPNWILEKNKTHSIITSEIHHEFPHGSRDSVGDKKASIK